MATQLKPRSSWGRTAALVLGASVLVTLVLLAFSWPSATSKVKDLPVAVVGSGAQADAIKAKLTESGSFAVSTRPDRAAAVAALQHRELYAAVVSTERGVEMLTASAASPVVAQAMGQVAAQAGQGIGQQVAQAKTQAGQQAAKAGAQAAATQASYQTLLGVQQQLPEEQRPSLQPKIDESKRTADEAAQQAQQSAAAADAIVAPTLTTTDVVPLSSDDPRGSGLGLLGLPIAWGGMVGGAMISLLLVGRWQRLAAVAGYAVLGGFGLMSVMTWGFGILPGAWWGTWGIFGLAVAAIAATIVGLHSWLGYAGILIGAVVTMFFGTPMASTAAPVEFMPKPWGAAGQLLVPGAAATLLRLHSYFPAASLTGPLVVLGCWTCLGLALILFAPRRPRAAHAAEDGA